MELNFLASTVMVIVRHHLRPPLYCQCGGLEGLKVARAIPILNKDIRMNQANLLALKYIAIAICSALFALFVLKEYLPEISNAVVAAVFTSFFSFAILRLSSKICKRGTNISSLKS